jgi:hypothetical protein
MPTPPTDQPTPGQLRRHRLDQIALAVTLVLGAAAIAVTHAGSKTGANLVLYALIAVMVVYAALYRLPRSRAYFDIHHRNPDERETMIKDQAAAWVAAWFEWALLVIAIGAIVLKREPVPYLAAYIVLVYGTNARVWWLNRKL